MKESVLIVSNKLTEKIETVLEVHLNWCPYEKSNLARKRLILSPLIKLVYNFELGKLGCFDPANRVYHARILFPIFGVLANGSGLVQGP